MSDFFMAEPFCFPPVTLDYKIDFCNQGSNFNIFDIKISLAVTNLAILNLFV
jgi:hypothetical protein